jgi:rubrerythrin
VRDLKRRFEELNAQEVLALAIAVEEANTSRFKTLADMYEGYDQDLRNLFLTLRDEEIHHKKILEEEWKRRFGDEPKPQIDEADVRGVIEAVDLEEGEHAIFDDLSREKALRLVEMSEDAAQKFYRSAAARCSDPGLKALYVDLAAMEAGHIESLGNLARGDAKDS